MSNNYHTLITYASEGFRKASTFECAHRKIIIPGRINQFFMSLNKIALKKIKKINTSYGMNKIDPHHSLSRYLNGIPIVPPTQAIPLFDSPAQRGLIKGQ